VESKCNLKKAKKGSSSWRVWDILNVKQQHLLKLILLKNILIVMVEQDRNVYVVSIHFPTMGGHTFWTNLCEYQGYKLQQNQFTHHARILDSNDIRIAWGTVNGMEKTLERMANMATKSINAANMVHKKILLM
jgi:hypothetical protein